MHQYVTILTFAMEFTYVRFIEDLWLFMNHDKIYIFFGHLQINGVEHGASEQNICEQGTSGL